MAKRAVFIAVWTAAFFFSSAMLLGFASGCFFAAQSSSGSPVREHTAFILGISWAAVPMLAVPIGLLLGVFGKLPGTRKQSEAPFAGWFRRESTPDFRCEPANLSLGPAPSLDFNRHRRDAAARATGNLAGYAMSHRPLVTFLVVLAVLSVILDIVGGFRAPKLQPASRFFFLYGCRLFLDIAIVAGFFVRRRGVWVTLMALYTVGLLGRAAALALLIPRLLGVTPWPFLHGGAAWLMLGNFCIGLGCVVLLSLRGTREYFGYEPSG